MKPHKYIVVNILLCLVSFIGYSIMLLPCFVYTVIVLSFSKRFKGKRKQLFNGWLWNLAIANDQAGNVLIQYPGNDILLKPNRTKSFGNPNETISHVLGWSEYDKALYTAGKKVAKGLNKIDKNHTKEAKANPQ